MQLDFFHLFEVEKKPELLFEDVDPVTYLREKIKASDGEYQPQSFRN